MNSIVGASNVSQRLTNLPTDRSVNERSAKARRVKTRETFALGVVKQALTCSLICSLLLISQGGVRVVGQEDRSGQDDAVKETRIGSVTYPETRKSGQVDNYHGTVVPDPYRWLEEENSQATKSWIESQNRVTDRVLAQIPQRPPLQKRLTELWQYARMSPPVEKQGRLFYMANDGTQDQNVLMMANGFDVETEELQEPRVLIDPNTMSDDGTVTLGDWEVSPDGKKIAYQLGEKGSDWRTARVLDITTGETLADEINWIKFSGLTWAADSRGFYYSRYDEPDEESAYTARNYFHKLYYHELGDPQSDDRLVYQRADEKEWGFGAEVTEDGRYLVIEVWKGTLSQNQVFYQDLSLPVAERETVELLTGFTAENLFVGNSGSKFFFASDDNAPRRRILAIDVEQPEREQWQEIVPQADAVIRSASLVGGRLVVAYLRNAHSQVRVFNLDGEHQADLEFPGLGTVSGLTGGAKDEATYYSFQNYTTPPSVYRYDVREGGASRVQQPNMGFDPDDFVTRQEFYTSSDGTQVPMFITHRKDLSFDRPQPTILYGYGGFDIAITPTFSVPNLAWIEAGGVYVVANLRGGGEFGREWHEAGMLDKKQNVFDDFIAAAEALHEQGIASPETLAISGRSNGGLLVGAVMCQRPELFAAALPGVGVMDMLRFHQFTIGYAWVSEYGSADDPQQFKTLYAYSPLHNLKPGTRYPATLVLTADHDDRVVPAHSFKFAARLQACQDESGPPCLIRIETRGGHGAGKPISMQIEEATDSLGFLAYFVGLELE